jgi:prevent-host-death family protein
MKDIGVRELKIRASEIVREVAEGHAMYTITRRGRAVGILAPPDFLVPPARGTEDDAWERLTATADRIGLGRGPRRSAVRDLEQTRR